MPKIVLILTVGLLVASATRTFGAIETVKGRLVDMTCYIKDSKSNSGAEHRECMQECATKGLQVALVIEEGARRALPGQPNVQRVYIVKGPLTAQNNAKLVPHMSHIVELTGNVTWKDGVEISATDVKHISE